MAGKLEVGQTIEPRQLMSITDVPVDVPDPGQLVHLQLRRYAGCPICNLHLRELARRHEEIAAAGVREVVVFNSEKKDILPYQRELPFAVIADPGRSLYGELGAEISARSILDPRAWPASMKGVLGNWALPRDARSMLALPLDVLIGKDGRVLDVHYGAHADDKWSVDELLAIAARHR
jgi:peroxiredoxin